MKGFTNTEDGPPKLTPADLRTQWAVTLTSPRRRYSVAARALFALLDVVYGRPRTLEERTAKSGDPSPRGERERRSRRAGRRDQAQPEPANESNEQDESEPDARATGGDGETAGGNVDAPGDEPTGDDQAGGERA